MNKNYQVAATYVNEITEYIDEQQPKQPKQPIRPMAQGGSWSSGYCAAMPLNMEAYNCSWPLSEIRWSGISPDNPALLML